MNEKVFQDFLARVAERISTQRAPSSLKVLFPDKWIACSTMQKAIRRGDCALALAAAEYLRDKDMNMLRRRLGITAVEDVGVADLGFVGVTLFVCTNYAFLPAELKEKAIKACVVDLASSAKERSADYLQTAIEVHPSLDLLRERLAERTPCELKEIVTEPQRYLVERSAAAWLLAGVDVGHTPGMPDVTGDRELYDWAVKHLNVPYWLPYITNMAGRRYREPMIWQLPVKAGHVSNCSGETVVHKLPAVVATGGIPHYALDFHTRLGKEAIRRFLASYSPLKRMKGTLPHVAWNSTVAGALFNLEAALVDVEYIFPEYEAIRVLGVEADACRYGLPLERLGELNNVLVGGMDTLDQIREDILLRTVGHRHG